MGVGHNMQFIRHLHTVETTIKTVAKKRGWTVYGAQAMNVRMHGPLRKFTVDYDLYSNTPKKSAHRLERALDKSFGGDYFYTSRAAHPGTWKVKTQPRFGDREVADFSKTPRGVKRDKIGGIHYVRLTMTERDKKKSLADKQYAFRHAKDRADLWKIQAQKRRNTWKKKRY